MSNIVAFKQRPMDTPPDKTAEEKAKAKFYYDFRRVLIKLLNRDYHVYVFLQDKQGQNEDSFYSIPTMMDECAIDDKRTLVKILDRFETLGLISIVKEKGKVNRYRVHPQTSELLERLNAQLPPPKNKELGTKNVPTSIAPTQKAGTKNDPSLGTKNVSTTRYKKCTPNESHVTNPNNDINAVSNETGANAPPTFSEKRFVDDLDDRYKQTGSNKISLVGEAFQHVFKQPPDYARLGKMAKDYGSGWKLIQLILELSAFPVHDNPHDYLQKTMRSRLQKDNRGQSPPYARRKEEMVFNKLPEGTDPLW